MDTLSRMLLIHARLQFLCAKMFSLGKKRKKEVLPYRSPYYVKPPQASSHLKLSFLIFLGVLFDSVSFHKNKCLPQASRVSFEWAHASLGYDS